MKRLFSYFHVIAVAACIGIFSGVSFGKEIRETKSIPGHNSMPGMPGHMGHVVVGSMVGTMGTYLVDDRGRTLYMFEADSLNMSHCNEACAEAWPPLLTTTEADIHVSGNVMEGLVGTIMRTDGTRQVTYNGMPLYYFVKDRNSGDTTGQGVFDFGATWYLVRFDGTKIT